MLDINVEFKGNKTIINGLNRFADRSPGAVKRGLSRIVRGTHREAYDLLSGSRNDTGGYPVPVVTGHLRRQLDFLDPGESKTVDGVTFVTDDFEAMLFDSARYASVVHDGTHSSTPHGPRPFTEDALEAFDEGGRIEEIMNEELDSELQKIGK